MRPVPEVLDEIILAKTAQAKKKSAEAVGKGNFAEALRLLNSRMTVIQEAIRNGLVNDFEKLERELSLLDSLVKAFGTSQDDVGKILQSQVEDFTKKRGAYVDARGGKKFVLNRRVRGADHVGQREMIEALRHGLMNLGADSRFLTDSLVCFTELLTNTVDHGCRADPHGLELQVMLLFRKSSGKIHIVGPGAGFNVDAALERARGMLTNPPDENGVNQRCEFWTGSGEPVVERGRGLAFILFLAGEESLFYSDAGREVQLEISDRQASIVTADPGSFAAPGKKQITAQTRREGRRSILELKVDGELDMYRLPQLKERVNEAVENGVVDIILRMEDLHYIDSSGMGFVLKNLMKCRDAGGQFVLCGPIDSVIKTFSLCRLDQQCRIFKDIETARAAFRTR